MILWSRSLVLIHNVLKDLGHLSKSSADKNSIKGKITTKKKLKYFLSPFLPLISLFPVSWVYLVSDQRMELRSWWAVLIAVAICLTSSDCHPAELLSNCFVFFLFHFFYKDAPCIWEESAEYNVCLCDPAWAEVLLVQYPIWQ